MMQLSIDIEQHKSPLFIDLLNLLKKDSMIRDYRILNHQPYMTDDEQALLDDLPRIADAIRDAKAGKGKKTSLKISL